MKSNRKGVHISTMRIGSVALVIAALASSAAAQQALTWEQVKAKFEAANPTLQADQIGVQEMKDQEITAYLRPNPQFTLAADGTQVAPHGGIWQPLAGTQYQPNFSYLHERQHKRELRLESAKQGTQIAGSQHEPGSSQSSAAHAPSHCADQRGNCQSSMPP